MALTLALNQDASYLGPVLLSKANRPGDIWRSDRTLDDDLSITDTRAK